MASSTVGRGRRIRRARPVRRAAIAAIAVCAGLRDRSVMRGGIRCHRPRVPRKKRDQNGYDHDQRDADCRSAAPAIVFDDDRSPISHLVASLTRYDRLFFSPTPASANARAREG